LKPSPSSGKTFVKCRAPRGARGLKQKDGACVDACPVSRPARGAWIETSEEVKIPYISPVAPRAGRVD